MSPWRPASWVEKVQLYRSAWLFRVWQKTRQSPAQCGWGQHPSASQFLPGSVGVCERWGNGWLPMHLFVEMGWNGFLERPAYLPIPVRTGFEYYKWTAAMER